MNASSMHLPLLCTVDFVTKRDYSIHCIGRSRSVALLFVTHPSYPGRAAMG
jgi:hypothetical protein